jgi:hypothetical protein
MIKNKKSLHKLPKQQSTSFWSQGILGVNPKTPLSPICGIWMTLKPPGSQEKVIFHPTFLEQLGRQVVHYIQVKNHFGKSPSFYKDEFYKKNMDDHEVHLKKIDFIC